MKITIKPDENVYHFIDSDGDLWVGVGESPETAHFIPSPAVDENTRSPFASLGRVIGRIGYGPSSRPYIGLSRYHSYPKWQEVDFEFEQRPVSNDPLLPRDYDFAKGDRRFFDRDEAMSYALAQNAKTGEAYQVRTIERAVLDRDDLHLVQAHSTLLANPDFVPWGTKSEPEPEVLDFDAHELADRLAAVRTLISDASLISRPLGAGAEARLTLDGIIHDLLNR